MTKVSQANDKYKHASAYAQLVSAFAMRAFRVDDS